MSDKPANTMWGGRFAMSPAEIMQEINASIGFDKRLAPQDIRGSKAHAQMLAEAGIITKADAREIVKGLDQLLAEIEAGTFEFSAALEDVHMNVESRLKDLIGAGCRAAAHGALAQRSGRDGFPALCPRRRSTASMWRWSLCSARWLKRPRRMRRPSCPVSRICSRRSR